MRIIAIASVFTVVLPMSAFANQNNGKAACLFQVAKQVPNGHGIRLKQASVTVLPNQSAFTANYRVDLTLMGLKHIKKVSWVCKYRYGNVERIFRVCQPNLKYPRTSAQNLSCLAPSVWR